MPVRLAVGVVRTTILLGQPTRVRSQRQALMAAFSGLLGLHVQQCARAFLS
jgi:hypothetical protein